MHEFDIPMSSFSSTDDDEPILGDYHQEVVPVAASAAAAKRGRVSGGIKTLPGKKDGDIGTVMVAMKDVKGRGKEWCELEPRLCGAPIRTYESISFLRIVAALRKTKTIRVRVGQKWVKPKPIECAAWMLGVSERAGKEIHSQLQTTKHAPSQSATGKRSARLALDVTLGTERLCDWVRSICVAHAARDERCSYRSIAIALRATVLD